MQVILLVEGRFGPVPDDITVVQEFGDETVVRDDGAFIDGVAMFLTGAPEAFNRWLRPFDGFWTSNNPLSGAWRVQHVPTTPFAGLGGRARSDLNG